MKENWKYKNFEDCLENVKYTNKIQTSDYLNSGSFPIISQEDVLISGYWNNSDDVFKIKKPIVIFGDHTRVLKYVDFDFVLGADGVKILQPTNELSTKFLFYFLIWQKIPSLGYSRHYKLLKELSIPIPPLSVQRQIVAELDLLSDIIEKQKQQIAELDKLAQATFYDMFGDPVTNEKGWEVKKLGEVGTVITGNTPSTKDEDNYSSDDYCFIKPSDIAKDGISLIYNSEFHISKKAFEKSRKLPIGSVLTTCIGIVGKVGILKIESTCNQQINAIIPNSFVNSTFLAFSILGERVILESIANAPVVPLINKSDFSQIYTIVPPLQLQQSFASKIEAIERQKELISNSIKESRKLFDSRMEYWFG